MKADLRKRLEELRAELESMRDVDEETRDYLRRLADELEPVVAAEEEEEPSIAEDLLERWNTALQSFELEHPVLARSVARISHVLSQMGF